MPPKSRHSKQEWHQCLKCKYLFYHRDTETHLIECDEKTLFSTCCIYENRLNGILSPISAHEAGNLQIPHDIINTVVLIHPSTMRHAGLSIGRLCVLDDQLVGTAWPSPSVVPTKVHVPEELLQLLGKKLDQIVAVEPLHSSLPVATEIYLKPSEDRLLPDDSCFHDFLKNKLGGKCFKKGNRVTVSYYGNHFHFVITNYRHEDINQSNVDQISLDLSVINLSDQSADSPVKSCDKSVSFENESVMSPVASTPKSKDRNLDLFKTPEPPIRKPLRTETEFFMLNSKTKYIIETDKEEDDTQNKVTFDWIGGLKSQIKTLREMVQLPLSHGDLFRSYGIPPPRGVLIYGPSGTGKSLLIKAVINDVSAHVITVSSSDVISKYFGESELKLRNIFKEAEEKAPSIIVMDDVDSMLPSRDKTQNDSQKRLVATMLTLMDGLNQTSLPDILQYQVSTERLTISLTSIKENEKKLVMVIAACCIPDHLDPALRRPGRFDKEIEVGVPTSTERREILQKLLGRIPNELDEKNIVEIADKAHGFVGADLASVCQQASLNSLKRSVKLGRSEEFSVLKEDISVAMTTVQPSGMREVQLEIPQVYWKDIGGQDEIKLKLKQAVEWPLLHPEAFDRMGIEPPRGILMYGPPGCSKTMIAKALATESGLNFIAIKGPELFNKWVGESERAVREVFRKARAAAPSIVFFDEIDALAAERGSSGGSTNVGDRVLAQLLTEIDGVERLKDVTVVAATNRPDMIDKALMRPGRLDRILYVPLPDDNTRRQILTINMGKMPVENSIDLENIVQRTKGYSGAEICAICHEAAMSALQENINAEHVTLKHFNDALTVVTPRTDSKLNQFYEEYNRKSGLHSI